MMIIQDIKRCSMRVIDLVISVVWQDDCHFSFQLDSWWTFEIKLQASYFLSYMAHDISMQADDDDSIQVWHWSWDTVSTRNTLPFLKKT